MVLYKTELKWFPIHKRLGWINSSCSQGKQREGKKELRERKKKFGQSSQVKGTRKMKATVSERQWLSSAVLKSRDGWFHWYGKWEEAWEWSSLQSRVERTGFCHSYCAEAGGKQITMAHRRSRTWFFKQIHKDLDLSVTNILVTPPPPL